MDGIKEHFRASEFSGENQMYCEECDAKCDATIVSDKKTWTDLSELTLISDHSFNCIIIAW